MQGIDRWGGRGAQGLRLVALGGVAFALALSASPRTAGAETGGLMLAEALSRALAQNKELAAFVHRPVEQAGRVLQAGALPNPELRLGVEEFAGSGSSEGFDSAETTLSLGWALDGRARRHRVRVERARSAVIDLDVRARRLDVAAETAQRFLSCLANQARKDAADEAVALAEETVVTVRRRVGAGRAPAAEQMRAEAELEAARLLREGASHDGLISRYRLATQWGSSTPDFTRVGGNLGAFPPLAPYAAFVERLDSTPEIARLVSEERLAKENVRLAEAMRWPTLRPSLGVRHFADGDDVALVAGLNLALPVFDRNQGQLAASRAAHARTRADAGAERLRARERLFELYEELQHGIHRAEALRTRIIPKLAAAQAEIRNGYDRGRYGYFEWRSVQAELLAAKNALIAVSTDSRRLVISLERLTGERVVTP
ncbi:MAG: TolC family protein [Deltaproteobacteria bacterium]|nr:TolC family protein [Deltaproteobacteria bacterium]